MQSERLKRLTVVFTKHPVYFLTLCTSQRRKILDRPAIHEAFARFCQASPAYGILVGSYVLMPDHLHLFAATTPEGLVLPSWVKSLKNALSKAWRDSAEPAPHWQKGFFDHLLRSYDSYAEKWAYVESNPVRAGLAVSVMDWPYRGTFFELRKSDIRRS